MNQLHKSRYQLIQQIAGVGLIVTMILLLSSCQSQTPLPEPTQTIPPTPIPSLAPTPVPSATQAIAPTSEPTTSDPTWERIQSAGKIVAAISADYPPFAYIDQNFAITGYDLALIQELSKRLNIPMEIHNMAFDGISDALLVGQIDIAVAAISVTPERDALIDFSNVYYVGSDAILAYKDSSITVQTVQDLAAYRVGVQTGSVYETWLHDTLVKPGLMPSQSLVTYTTPQEAVNALAGPNQQVDLVVMDNLPAQEAAIKSPVKIVAQSLNQQLYAIAIPQGAITLQAKLNEALTGMQNDGTLAALAKQWLNVEALPPPPTPAPTEPPATPSTCQDGMTFVQDLSYPDNQMRNPVIVAPGSLIHKGWRIRNSGNCTWDERYRLTYTSSAPPNAPVGGSPVTIQGSVAPGQTYDIYADMYAPSQSGIYQSFWSLQSFTGNFFGDRLYAGFQVVNPATSTPLPQRPAIYFFTATPNQVGQGQCLLLNWSFGGQDLIGSRLYRGNQLILQNLPLTSSFSDCPPGTGPVVYQLMVDSRYSGTASASQSVYIYPLIGPTVVPTFAPQPLIISFTADPTVIEMGECAIISWVVQGEGLSQIQIFRHNNVIAGNLGPGGSLQDCPLTAGRVPYRLDVTTQFGGWDQQTIHITVIGPLTYQPFSAIQRMVWTITDMWNSW